MHARTMMTALTCLALAGSAMAGPRDTITLNNVNSDGPNTGGNSPLAVANAYTAKYVRVQGTLTKVTPSATFAREAVINLLPPGAQLPTLVATTAQTTFSGSINVDTFVRLAAPTAAAGSWNINAMETYDDGAGADARWDTLTVTLNDGPPTNAVNLGVLTAGTVTYHRPIAVQQYHWYKFDLQGDVNAGALTYLDIDTEGSAIFDTELALFDENGASVGYDDDRGSNGLSQLTYGAGTRPAVGNGQPYDGSEGPLPAGTYYLLVRGYGPDFPEVGWQFSGNTSTQAGDVRVNIRTNVGLAAGCEVDFNRDGTLQVQDLFDYLNAWFAGCP